MSALGSLGLAILSAPTVRPTPSSLGMEFLPIVTTALGLRLRVEGRASKSVIIEEHADFGSVRDIVLLAPSSTSLWRIGARMTGEAMTGYADLALPEPPYFAHVGRIGAHVRFNPAGDPAGLRRVVSSRSPTRCA